MSGIGGIFNFSNQPVDEAVLATLGEALSRRGPDGGRELRVGPVGMSYRAFHTNRVSKSETQPFVTRFGHMLAWDGRLDNRDDLLVHFPNGLDGDKTDAALVMASYLEWDVEALPRIIADFVLSLYDPTKKTILLARDPFGTRTLYYSANDRQLFWSSTLHGLLLAARIDPQVDDEYIAGYMTLQPEMSHSPYKNISAVAPGHVVVVRRGIIQQQRFWTPDPKKEIRYGKDTEYEDHFLQLFRDAVRCRLQVDRPVWSELSGGLDSSSIVCIADQVLDRNEASAPRLETVSYIDRESETSDDQSFIRLVEEKRGRTGHHLERRGSWVRFVSPEESFLPRPSTNLCVAGSHQWLGNAMRDDGARVLLSGLGGDQVLWSVPQASPILADLLFRFKPIDLHRELQAWSQILKRPYTQLLWRETVLPFLPDSLRAKFESRIKVAPWLERRFVKRMKLQRRTLLPDDPFHFRLPSKQMQSSRILFVISEIAQGECWESSSFNRTYPLLHRPLVEFLVAIPFEQKLRGTETRSLMRRALRDLLPERVVQRKGKGTTGETFCRGLALEWPILKPMFTDARVYSLGYVDRKSFRSALDLARHGCQEHISTLLKTISLEIWLRSLEFWCARPLDTRPHLARSQLLAISGPVQA
jgi:asparagine synthase (glutamine-hydrolysing)